MRSTRASSLATSPGMAIRSVCSVAGSREPRLHATHRLEGADHQAGADQQHQRQRHLDDRQRVAGDVAVAAGAGVAAAGRAAPRRGGRGACFSTGIAPKARPAATDTTSVNTSDVASTAISSSRGSLAGFMRQDQLQRGDGEADAGGAAEQAEQQALDQHLAGQAAAAGADGGADGELLGAALGPDEQEVGDVGAGDEQDDPDRRHHHPQALADVADEIVEQRADVRPEPRVLHHLDAHPLRRRELGQRDADHPRDVGVDLREGDAGAEPADRLEVVAGETHLGAVEAERHHEIVASCP